MDKFLNAGLHYFPVSAVIAINVSADDDDCVVTVAGIRELQQPIHLPLLVVTPQAMVLP